MGNCTKCKDKINFLNRVKINNKYYCAYCGEKIKVRGKVSNDKKELKSMPFWAYIILWVLVILTILIDPLGLFVYIIGGFVAQVCAQNCHRMAQEINKNKTIALLIGMFGSLIGLLFYWLYYKTEYR
jgi:dolichol kinase